MFDQQEPCLRLWLQTKFWAVSARSLFRCGRNEIGSMSQIVRSSHAITFKVLNLEPAQGHRPGVTRGTLSTTISMCLLSFDGIRTRSYQLSNIQKRHDRRASEPDHLLDSALRGDTVHSQPQKPSYLDTNMSCGAFAHLKILTSPIRKPRQLLYNTNGANALLLARRPLPS